MRQENTDPVDNKLEQTINFCQMNHYRVSAKDLVDTAGKQFR